MICNIALWTSWFAGKIHYWRKNYEFEKAASPFVDPFVYNIFHTCFIILTFVAFIQDILVYHGYKTMVSSTHYSLFYCIIMSGLITIFSFSVFYDSVGYYYILIMGMAKHTAHFIFLFVLFAIPFMATSERILLHSAPADNCRYDFKLGVETAYTLVLTLMNSYNFLDGSPATQDVSPMDLKSLRVLHIIFIFTTIIVLINFLIALFSSTANTIISTKDIHLLIGRLSVSKQQFLILN